MCNHTHFHKRLSVGFGWKEQGEGKMVEPDLNLIIDVFILLFLLLLLEHTSVSKHLFMHCITRETIFEIQ